MLNAERFSALCFKRLAFSVIVINLVPDHCLVTEYLAETSYIFAAPAAVHFAVFTKLAAHQIVGRFYAGYLETVRHQRNKYLASYVLLGAFEVGFDIAHHRIEDLTFVQP